MKNILFIWMAMSTKQKMFAVFSFLFIIFIIVMVVRSKKKKKKAAEEKAAEEEAAENTSSPDSEEGGEEEEEKESQLVLPLGQAGTIADMPPTVRAIYGKYHDELFEAKKWYNAIPSFGVHLGWKVRPLPAFGNAVVRMEVESKFGSKVMMLFDPYGIHTDEREDQWDVYCSKIQDRELVELTDTKKLKSVIAAMFKKADADKQPVKKPTPNAKPAKPKRVIKKPVNKVAKKDT